LTVARVVLMGRVKRLAGGRAELEIELPEGSTVQTLIEKVADMCGTAFAEEMLTEDGRILHHLAIFVNGQRVDTGGLQPTQTILSGGQVQVDLTRLY